MAAKTTQTVIQAAISNDGERPKLYEAAAAKAELTYSHWVIQQCDVGLTKSQRKGLLPVVNRGKPNKN